MQAYKQLKRDTAALHDKLHKREISTGTYMLEHKKLIDALPGVEKLMYEEHDMLRVRLALFQEAKKSGFSEWLKNQS